MFSKGSILIIILILAVLIISAFWINSFNEAQFSDWVGFSTMLIVALYTFFTYKLFESNKEIRAAEFEPFLCIDNPDQFDFLFLTETEEGAIEFLKSRQKEEKVSYENPRETFLAIQNLGKGAAFNIRTNHVDLGNFKVDFEILKPSNPLPAVGSLGKLENLLYKRHLVFSASQSKKKIPFSDMLKIKCEDQFGKTHIFKYRIESLSNYNRDGLLVNSEFLGKN